MTRKQDESEQIVSGRIFEKVKELRPKKDDGPVFKFEPILRQMVRRHQMKKECLASPAVFEEYVKSHKDSALIQKRIRSAVKLKKHELKRLPQNQMYENIDQASEIVQFHALASSNLAKIHPVIPELPENITLCQIATIVECFEEWYATVKDKLTEEQRQSLENIFDEVNEIWDQYTEAMREKWLAITGSELSLKRGELPRLEELEAWKAPIPLRPAWTTELNSMEARQTGHHTALDEEDEASPETAPLPVDEDEAIEEQGDNQDPASQYLEKSCAISKFRLYDRNGFTPLGKPQDLHTFPGKLSMTENIFYDYAVIIPVESCWLDKTDQDQPRFRDWTAAKVLADKAHTILGYLDKAGLTHVLGLGVYDEIEAELNKISSDLETDSVTDARDKKRKFKALAGLLRLISRTEMLMPPGGADPVAKLDDLEKTISDIRKTQFQIKPETRMPTVQEGRQLLHPTLYFPGVKSPEGEYGRENWNGCVNVPNAIRYDSYLIKRGSDEDYDGAEYGEEDGGWMWWPGTDFVENKKWRHQKHDLRNYIIYLGRGFYPLLRDLVAAAEAMRDEVQDFKETRGEKFNNFEQLAAEKVNTSVEALAHILDEIAAMITLPQKTCKEGHKRLALQLVYRQFWHPECYVMGKLVGYKTLIPNQKETVKRRTFVKTTREMTTAEEFATARQDDYSHSRKESAEVIDETSREFGLTANASGSIDFVVGSFETEVGTELNLGEKSKATQNVVSESTQKGSVKYNEKREVKIREMTEIEDVYEVTSDLHNANQEITANYFYYQLLRQYKVTIGLQDIRPVLLRTRDVPGPAEIDDHFVSKYIHILANRLPAQLSVDAQENADRLDMLAKRLIRRRADLNQRAAEFENFRENPADGEPSPDEPDEYNRWREEWRSKERLLAEARQAFIEAEEEYAQARLRMDRVINHVRENIHYYMQYIWHASPNVDQDVILRQEKIGDEYLPNVTRGLIRQGYYGNEEIFDYTGPSFSLLQLLLDHLTPGSELIGSMTNEELWQTPLFQYLLRYYPEKKEVLEQIVESMAFPTDPAQKLAITEPESVLGTRRVQIAQDALVVETMPGQVPLLEGFQMAHRMLDVQKSCLENVHLAERIAGKPWNRDGNDSYSVERYEGDAVPQKTITKTT